MIIGLIAGFIIIVFIDINNLLSVTKRKKTIFVYMCLLTTAFIISLLLILGKEPISPSQIIKAIAYYFIERN